MLFRATLLTLTILATPAFAQEVAPNPNDPKELERQGVAAKTAREFEAARDFFKRASEQGYYQAQVDYAFLLETGPAPVRDLVEAYGWYAVVATHRDTEFARDAMARILAMIPAAQHKKTEDHAQELVNQFGI